MPCSRGRGMSDRVPLENRILTSLADGPKHSYAIMTDVAAFSSVGMEPGTLYSALSRLERRG
jgi:DNA-binding PadR family transcriptional regulator